MEDLKVKKKGKHCCHKLTILCQPLTLFYQVYFFICFKSFTENALKHTIIN